MQGRSDTGSFIQAFTGSHRFVLDYLMEEVLQRQPERVRGFLLQTAILDRLSGPLCNAVTGQQDGKAMLETLERGNLFVIPLDDQRRWYRYHHLFAEVLRTHLQEAQPDRVSELHRRASVWYEQNDLPADAIRHALAGEDFARAANLIERVWLAMDVSYRSAAWLRWAQQLPADLIRAHPVLCLGYAWALLNGGELEACEAWLRDAERWIDPTPEAAAQPIVADEAEYRALPASIAAARAYRALALGDIPGTIAHARQALTLAAEDDVIRRTQATSLLGIAEYASGDLEPPSDPCSLSRRGCGKSATSQMPSASPSSWLTSGWRKVVCARPSAPIGKPCNSQRIGARRLSSERRTCTGVSVSCSVSKAIRKLRRSTC